MQKILIIYFLLNWILKKQFTYGFELRELYPEESTEDIFKRVFNAEIDDEDLKNNLIAIFDLLTDKNKSFFLRNMYDYVNNEENWE